MDKLSKKLNIIGALIWLPVFSLVLIFVLRVDIYKFVASVVLLGGFVIALHLYFTKRSPYSLARKFCRTPNTIEGMYKEMLYNQRNLVFDLLGREQYNRYTDKLIRKDIMVMLLSEKGVERNPQLKYNVCLGVAMNSWGFAEFDDVIRYAAMAKEIHPDDLVANLELARAYEAKGMATEAITAYKAALQAPSISADITEELMANIKRVEELGPNTSGPYAGSGLNLKGW